VKKPWEVWEDTVQKDLGLAGSPGSGNQWHAISDGHTLDHPADNDFRLMVDCKSTTRKSFSLGRQVLAQWVGNAGQQGCRFALPLRFLPVTPTGQPEDYVVIPYDDYLEMMAWRDQR
jgi:hypothetical protein